jgi:hypothetical protein
MWPISGLYRCPECHRTFPVLWSIPEAKGLVVESGRHTAAPAFSGGILADHPGMNQAR